MSHTKRSPDFLAVLQRDIATLQRLSTAIASAQVTDLQVSLSAEESASYLEVLHRTVLHLRDNTTDAGCVVKAADDEPIFTLRGKDRFSDVAVTTWTEKVATYQANADLSPEAQERLTKKRLDALHCATEMREYPTRKFPD